MKTIGDKLEAFSVQGVKPGFNHHEENGVSAFETITEKSFPGKWKVIYFWPKDFTFVCPTEIVGFDKLAQAVRGARRGPARRLDRQRVLQARLASRPQGPDQARPLELRRLEGLARRPARHPRQERRRGAARDLHRRPGQHDPARERQQPQRRPQPGGSAAHPRRPADRRALPVQPRGRRRDALSTADRARLRKARLGGLFLDTSGERSWNSSPPSRSGFPTTRRTSASISTA